MTPYGPRIARIALSEAERETLRAVSQMRGFYYKQLGERLGVSGGTVHAYLQGKRHPTSDLLARYTS
jgi:transcriptional regulator with XRE-family HTH domain